MICKCFFCDIEFINNVNHQLFLVLVSLHNLKTVLFHSFPILLSPPGNHQSAFCLYELYYLDINIKAIVQCVLFCLTCTYIVSMVPWFTSFKDLIVFHCMHPLHMFIHSSADGHWVVLPFGYYNSAALNICV